MTPARATIYYNKERYGISIDMTMPQALLEKSVGKRLKDGRVMEGKLVGFDDLMNMSLEETVETVPGTEERRLGTVVLRGNNVVSISIL